MKKPKLRTVDEVLAEPVEEEIDELINLIKNQKFNRYKLDELAKHSNWKVRLAVAQIQIIDTYTLEYLSKDKEWRVREAVAKHYNTGRSVLRYFINDKSIEVKIATILNRTTLYSTLKRFLNDNDKSIVAIAQKQIRKRDNT